MAKPKKAAEVEMTKYRLMLVNGPSDNRILDYECRVDAPPRLLFVPIPPADFSEDDEDCRWRVGSYGLKSKADFDELGVHYLYEWLGILE